jgi:ABC-type Mn2+/Zn2+ transport system permease subunit
VVARDQVFLAAAVSQASTLGVAIGLFLGWTNPALLAAAFSVAAALYINHRDGREGTTHQETTGWVFLFASALAILLLVKQPFSLKQVQALTASTMIGATGREAMLFLVLGVALLAGALVLRDRLVLWLSDPVMAAAVGMRPGIWAAGLAIVLGLAAGLMLRSTGLLFTFGCLVLPALVAKSLARKTSSLFWLAPAIAAVGICTGLIAAHSYDYPPGQVIVVGLTLLALGANAFGQIRQRLLAT